jgi:glutaredoxin 3
MAKVEIYTKNWCPFSARAKELLDRKGVPYSEIDVTTDSIKELEMVNRSARHTVPQIFIDDYHLGGSDDLVRADNNGRLDWLLSGQKKEEAA